MKASEKKDVELIFIYNADAGFFNGMLDSAHKLFSPKTYSCDLCAVTHGLAGVKTEWREFIQSFSVPITYYHKNDRPQYLMEFKLPVILLKNSQGIQELVSADEMKRLENAKQLMDRLSIYRSREEE